MPLTFSEEIALRAAFMEIQRERKESLRAMFAGTQLVPKSRLDDAKALAKDAKAAKEKIAAIPGVGVPDLRLEVPDLNINIFRGINLQELLNFRIPTLTLPDIDLRWIPDVRIGSIPGFNLPQVRLNLKGILKYKDLLPDISLRALAYALAVKWPNINFPSMMLDLSKILNIDFNLVFPDLRLAYPDFFTINLEFRMPHLSLPDIDMPRLPAIGMPELSFGSFDLTRIDLPSLPRLLKIPGFDKVLRLLFELFDDLDLNAIIVELGAEFLTDFFSSALPLVQQVKAGAAAAQNWGTAASDWHKARKTTTQRGFLLPGNARDACDAVAVLLRNSRDEHATLAAIQTTQLAVSTAGLFADLGGATGPAVAAAASVAKTCQKIVIMGARYKEVKKVNLILTNTPEQHLCSNIFAVSPLLGCYYLANNTTSNILNLLCDNILADDWMSDWEKNKREHLDPLMRECTRFISESRYVLNPVRQNKGMYAELSFTDKLKAGAKLYVKKKLGMAPAHARAPTHRYVG